MSLRPQLLAQLRQAPELYHAVFMAGEGEFFERNGLLYLNLDELAQLGDRLAAAQPLMGLLRRDFSGAAVVERRESNARAAPAAAAPADGAALDPLYAELAANTAERACGTVAMRSPGIRSSRCRAARPRAGSSSCSPRSISI